MTKRQLIEEIITMNHTAQPEFLARFQDSDLGEYLSHLRHARISRLIGNSSRYERFFRPKATMAIQVAAAGIRTEPSYSPPVFAPDVDESAPPMAAAAPVEPAAREVLPTGTAIVVAEPVAIATQYIGVDCDDDTGPESYRPKLDEFPRESDVISLETDVAAMREQVSVSGLSDEDETSAMEAEAVGVSAAYNGTSTSESSFARKEDKKWLF